MAMQIRIYCIDNCERLNLFNLQQVLYNYYSLYVQSVCAVKKNSTATALCISCSWQHGSDVIKIISVARLTDGPPIKSH